jgi:hypothetical protein
MAGEEADLQCHDELVRAAASSGQTTRKRKEIAGEGA